MKRYINILLGVVALSLFVACSDILEEQPRTKLTPDLFKTEDGLKNGLTAPYNGLRGISGTEQAVYCLDLATDEFINAAGNAPEDLRMETANFKPLTAESGSIDVFWNYSIPMINTCNGIIEYGTDAGLSEGLIAEARFLRAYYYFIMAQNYGDVPLDLGLGELKFNTSPDNTVKPRTPVANVYKAIVTDLKYAAEHLPIEPRLPGCAFRATAIHYLAKVYLTRSYLPYAESNDAANALAEAEKLLNPGNPYDKNAYNVALLESFAKVVEPRNEHSSEILFTCERTSVNSFNELPGGGGDGPDATKDGRAEFCHTTFYESWTFNGAARVKRVPEYGRPWRRTQPTRELLQNVFADKTNDSRFSATFQTVWLNNTAPFEGMKGETINVGDTAFAFVLDRAVDANYIASKNYMVFTYDDIHGDRYPTLKKIIDPDRAHNNDASGRPTLLAKLSETYLIAAEAALIAGNQTKAHDYIQVVRTRAAVPGKQLTTPQAIDIKYILDERSRELCGEQQRWFDLKRTGKWREYSLTVHSPNGSVVTRTIPEHYDLRPIPQAQISLMGNPAAEKAAYQNPGYN